MKKINSILLIDDDEADNEFHEIIIKESGVEAAVKNFTDSRKALNCWKKSLVDPAQCKLPDLIFLDINMPAINGFELLEEINKLPDPNNRKNKLNIFILSTSDPVFYKAEVEKCKNMVKGFYTKPLTQKAFLEILEEHY